MLFFYVCLVSLGSSQIKTEHITFLGNSNVIIWSIPVFIVSFGFQNLIPTISRYLGYHVVSIKSALFRGTITALMIYLIWDFILLGMIAHPNQLLNQSSSTFLTTLFNYSTPKITFLINSFSICAIITSFLSVSLSFVNFISDSSENKKHRIFYISCVILPPLLFSFLDPDIFLLALHVAGGIGAVSLFGILPAMMLWKTRYTLNNEYEKIFPFGRTFLISYGLVSVGIVLIEIVNLIPFIKNKL